MIVRHIRTGISPQTIFLLDEFHHCDPCTDDNIVAAKRLFLENVAIAGVEGFEGGLIYDTYDARYTESRINGDCRPSQQISDYPRFANALKAAGLLVIGVDCRGLADEIVIDFSEGRFKLSVADHPNQRQRSEHFVRTLSDEASLRGIEGDLLLSCGSAHNDHIEQILNSDTIPDHWLDCNYIRLRSHQFARCIEKIMESR